MTRLRALLDEMMPPAIAERLVTEGHDVVAVKKSPALISKPDHDILVAAAEQERILVTLNIRDFILIDSVWKQSGRAHHGLLYIHTSTIPLGNGFTGAVVRALTAAADAGRLPGPDQTMFLARASGD